MAVLVGIAVFVGPAVGVVFWVEVAVWVTRMVIVGVKLGKIEKVGDRFSVGEGEDGVFVELGVLGKQETSKKTRQINASCLFIIIPLCELH